MSDEYRITGTVEDALRDLLTGDHDVDVYWDESHVYELAGAIFGWFHNSGLDEKAWAKAANVSMTQAKKALTEPERVTIKTLIALASQAGYAVEVQIVPRTEMRQRVRREFGLEDIE